MAGFRSCVQVERLPMAVQQTVLATPFQHVARRFYTPTSARPPEMYEFDGVTNPRLVSSGPSRIVTRTTLALLFIIALLSFVLLGITAATLAFLHASPALSSSTSSLSASKSAIPLGLPGIESYSWDDIVKAANGQTVTFWATSVENYDNWIDQFLAPKVAAMYGITLKHHNEGSPAATKQIAAEKAAGNNENGSVTLVWTNGPNFAAQRSQGLLYGPWAHSVPNAANYDWDSAAIGVDFGQATAGYEFPYNSAQVTFLYNPQCPGLPITTPPQSMAELAAWVIAHPGRFTYANPISDYTGSVFIRHFIYELGGGHKKLAGNYDSNNYLSSAVPALRKLREMSTGIYRQPNSTAPYYPENQTLVDNLFANGSICITLSYDPDHAGQMIATPQDPGILNFPNSTKSWLPSTGTIGNVNFVAIAYNTPSLFGALVVTNYIGSMAAVYSRRSIEPPGIGTIQAYDPNCEAVTSGGWSVPLEALPSYPQTPPVVALRAAFMPEVDGRYADQLNVDWGYCVLQSGKTASGTEFGNGSGVSCG